MGPQMDPDAEDSDDGGEEKTSKKKGEAKKVLARGVVRYDRSASSYPICLSLPATQVCHIWSALCNASQQDGFTRCFFGQAKSTELEFVAEATVQRGCVVASFCSRSSSIDGERHMRRWLISAYQDGFTRCFFRPGPEYRAGICGRSHCTARLCRRELLQPELKHRWGAAKAKMADQCVPAISGLRCRLLKKKK